MELSNTPTPPPMLAGINLEAARKLLNEGGVKEAGDRTVELEKKTEKKQADAVNQPITNNQGGVVSQSQLTSKTTQETKKSSDTFKATFKLPAALRNINLTSIGSTIFKEFGKLFGSKEYTLAQAKEAKKKGLEIYLDKNTKKRISKNDFTENMYECIKGDKKFTTQLIALLNTMQGGEDLSFCNEMMKLDKLKCDSKLIQAGKVYDELIDKINISGRDTEKMNNIIVDIKQSNSNEKKLEFLELYKPIAEQSLFNNLDYVLRGIEIDNETLSKMNNPTVFK